MKWLDNLLQLIQFVPYYIVSLFYNKDNPDAWADDALSFAESYPRNNFGYLFYAKYEGLSAQHMSSIHEDLGKVNKR